MFNYFLYIKIFIPDLKKKIFLYIDFKFLPYFVLRGFNISHLDKIGIKRFYVF